MKPIFSTILCALFALGAQIALAQTFNPVITQTVGTGSSTSYFVINFNDGTNSTNNPTSDYAFAYQYDGSKNGGDLVDALVSQAGLGTRYQSFAFGRFITQFSYNGHTQSGDGGSGSAGYWAYYVGNDGQNWVPSDVGQDSRPLTNGSWDGWSWAPNDFANPPVTPQAAPPGTVPEPSSLCFFAFGTTGLGLLIGWRARRQMCAQI